MLPFGRSPLPQVGDIIYGWPPNTKINFVLQFFPHILSYHLLFFSVRRYEDPLNKYVYLTDLLCTNQRLFYKLLSENVEEMMPIVYTPTVGLACQKFGYIFTKPQVKIAIFLLIV